MRRNFLVSLAVTAIAAPAWGQSGPQPTPLEDLLLGAAKALRHSQDTMARLTERLSAMAAPGASAAAPKPLSPGVAAQAAANLQSAELMAVYQEYLELRLMQTTQTSPALRAFAERPDPNQWERVKQRLLHTAEAIRRVDAQIAALGPDFVLTPLYPELRMNLGMRSATLLRLADAPPPRTKGELAAYKTLVGDYLGLLGQMQQLGEAFRAYAERVRAAEGAPSNAP